MVMFVGYLQNNAIVFQTGLIFMAHSILTGSWDMD